MKNYTADDNAFRILNIIDEYSREYLATFAVRKIKAIDVLDRLFRLFVFRGVPQHIRSDVP